MELPHRPKPNALSLSIPFDQGDKNTPKPQLRAIMYNREYVLRLSGPRMSPFPTSYPFYRHKEK